MGNTSSASLPDVRVVLLGKCGEGKSTLGCELLKKENAFPVGSGFDGKTQTTKVSTNAVNGREVLVVDTPGFFDSHIKDEDVEKEVIKSIGCAVPGPHVFIIVISKNRFTKQDEEVLNALERLFSTKGQELYQYAMIVFTKTEDNTTESLSKVLEQAPQALKTIVEKCEHRFEVFDTKHKNKGEQIEAIIKRGVSIIEKNGVGYYSDDMFYKIDMEVRDEAVELKQDFQIVRADMQEESSSAFQRVLNAFEERMGLPSGFGSFLVEALRFIVRSYH